VTVVFRGLFKEKMRTNKVGKFPTGGAATGGKLRAPLNERVEKISSNPAKSGNQQKIARPWDTAYYAHL
jgi:hypothetical protein